MLVPAQLYKEELAERLVEFWYDPKYQWYFAGGREMYQVEDNAYWKQQFVHLDSDGNMDGLFSYNYDDASKSMSQFGLVSFAKNGAPLVFDAISRVKQMFVDGAQRCEFRAFTENPACKMYEKLASRYGGRKVGVMHRSAYFNGAYHDIALYEFLIEDIKASGVKL